MSQPVVGIVMGSSSDWPVMCKAVEILVMMLWSKKLALS